jgi:uncharacterized repeat protein (TIGR01451 family)
MIGTAASTDGALGTTCGNSHAKKGHTTSCVPDLEITKTAPRAVALGEKVTFTITVANVGRIAVHRGAVTVTDLAVSPASLVRVSVPAGDHDAWLEPGETWAYGLPDGPATTSAQTCQPVVNTAYLAPVGREKSRENDVSSSTTKVICTRDLAITKVSDKSAYVPGETVRYTISVTNAGQLPIPLAEIEVTDPSLPGLAPIGEPPDVLLPGGTVSYAGARIATVGDCGTIANVATVSFTGKGKETTLENNTAAATASVICAPGLSLVKRADLTTYAPGQSIVYTLVVTNTGQTTIPFGQVRVSDPSLPGLTVVGPAPASLEPGSTVSFRGTRATSVADCGPVTNTAAATFAPPGAAPLVVSATTTVTVAGGACVPQELGAVLSIDKRGPRVARARTPILYTVVVTNTGPVIARNVVVVESIPRGMVLVRRPKGAKIVRATVRWAVGDLAPGQTATLRATLKSTFAGASTRCNTAGADAENAAQVTDSLCTRFAAVAGQRFVPAPVTG